jgi:hypothetical protein
MLCPGSALLVLMLCWLVSKPLNRTYWRGLTTVVAWAWTERLKAKKKSLADFARSLVDVVGDIFHIVLVSEF